MRSTISVIWVCPSVPMTATPVSVGASLVAAKGARISSRPASIAFLAAKPSAPRSGS
jgi:hypothetical protein